MDQSGFEPEVSRSLGTEPSENLSFRTCHTDVISCVSEAIFAHMPGWTTGPYFRKTLMTLKNITNSLLEANIS